MTIDTSIKFTNQYWDCICPVHYIHSKRSLKCPVCGVRQKEGSSSIQQEIGKEKLMFHDELGATEIRNINRGRKQQTRKEPWYNTYISTREGIAWCIIVDGLFTILLISLYR